LETIENDIQRDLKRKLRQNKNKNKVSLFDKGQFCRRVKTPIYNNIF